MSGLAGLLAHHVEPGIYRWHGALRRRGRAAHGRARRLALRRGRRLARPDQGGVPGGGRRGARASRRTRAELRRARRLPGRRHRGRQRGLGAALGRLGPLAREDERAFSVALSVLGGRVNADKGGRFAVLLRGDGPDIEGVPGSTDGSSNPASRELDMVADIAHNKCSSPRSGGNRRRPPTRQTTRSVTAVASSRSTARAWSSTSARCEGGDGVPGELADDLLDLLVGAGGVDDPAQRGRPRRRRAPCRGRRRARAASSAGAASSASATSTVRLPSTRSSPAGLPVVDRVAEDAEQVVAQLERLAERQPERRQLGQLALASAPARAAPMWSGRSMEYLADL